MSPSLERPLRLFLDGLMRTPFSMQRNKSIQRVLVKAANLAPRQNYDLALVPSLASISSPHQIFAGQPDLRLSAQPQHPLWIPLSLSGHKICA